MGFKGPRTHTFSSTLSSIARSRLPGRIEQAALSKSGCRFSGQTALALAASLLTPWAQLFALKLIECLSNLSTPLKFISASLALMFL